jgi:hypothetical protein
MKKFSQNKKFGFTFFCVFMAIALIRYFNYGFSFETSACISLGILFLIASVLEMKILNSLSNTWLKFGNCLGRITSPILLAIIFFLIITPIGILSRVFGRDELKLKKLSCESYWQNKKQIIAKSFSHQF